MDVDLGSGILRGGDETSKRAERTTAFFNSTKTIVFYFLYFCIFCILVCSRVLGWVRHTATAMPKRKQHECATVSSQPVPPPLPAAILGPRRVLPDFNNLEKLLDLLRKSKRIVVLTGAGIRQEDCVYEGIRGV